MPNHLHIITDHDQKRLTIKAEKTPLFQPSTISFVPDNDPTADPIVLKVSEYREYATILDATICNGGAEVKVGDDKYFVPGRIDARPICSVCDRQFNPVDTLMICKACRRER